MSSRRRASAVASALLALGLAAGVRGAGPRFYPDDPIAVDNDRAFDAGGAQRYNLSEWYDFALNQFGDPGERDRIPALNINTLGEVPDSSWFTNRIGQRPMTVAEIARGPDSVERLEVEEWLVTDGKGPAGFQPGFRGVNARDPRPMAERTLYQLEVDLEDFPDLATSSEIIGTAIYHAIGYNVVDTYIVNVDPKKVRVAPGATVRDPSGRRPLTQRDVDEVFKLGAKNADGTYRMSASRFVEGRQLGNFTHYGTRPDDPNDIYPHEHRRELRANRVFSAWINHDDSRALNTLDMLVGTKGREYIKHYMFDFGSILGSSPERRVSGHQYMFEGSQTWRALATLGLWLPGGELAPYPSGRLYRYAGLIEAEDFDAAGWKPSYPNAAFANMRPDDAFWAARIVAAFSDEALAAIVRKAKFRDQRAEDYILKTLIERRDKVMAAWLPAVNPLVNFVLASDGTLTFANAAAVLKGSTPPTGYAISWSRFDNASDTHQAMGGDTTVSSPSAKAPAGFENGQFLAVSVKTVHPGHPGWAQPVRAYFRREGSGWKTVGLERLF